MVSIDNLMRDNAVVYVFRKFKYKVHEVIIPDFQNHADDMDWDARWTLVN